MDYFLFPIILSLVVFLSNSFFFIKGKREKIIILIISLGLALLSASWSWLSSDYYLVGPTPMFVHLILFLITSLVINLFWVNSKLRYLPAIILFAISIYVTVVSFFLTSPIVQSTDLGKVLSVQEESSNSKIISPADVKHVALVSDVMAMNKANDALSKFKLSDGAAAGSRYTIGSPTKQLVNSELWWIIPVEFDGLFKWWSDETVPGYLKINAENPLMPAEAVQIDAKGKNIDIKYLNSAFWNSNALRYLRNNGYLNSIITDFTFEVDENWRPYYTASIYTRTIGFSGYKLMGVALLDVQTGEIKNLSLNDLEKSEYNWIDRAVDLNYLDEQSKDWGLYANSSWWSNLFNKSKTKQPTPGWYLIYSDNRAKWFTGWTSINNQDQALTGFSLTDAKNGQTIYYRASGVTEDIAYNTAQSHWSNFSGYVPQDLSVYNIYNHLTYVVPIAYNGQFKGVSLIALDNKDINAKGLNIEEALSSYRNASARAGNGNIDISSVAKTSKIKAKILEIGLPIFIDNKQFFVFKLVGQAKVFQISFSDKNIDVPFIKQGDEIEITYNETEEKVVTCESLKIVNREVKK